MTTGVCDHGDLIKLKAGGYATPENQSYASGHRPWYLKPELVALWWWWHPTSPDTGSMDGHHDRLWTLQEENNKNIFSVVHLILSSVWESEAPCSSDLLYDGERLLILDDCFSDVPGNSGRVVALRLEYVAGHVHQVNTWTATEHREEIQLYSENSVIRK